MSDTKGDLVKVIYDFSPQDVGQANVSNPLERIYDCIQEQISCSQTGRERSRGRTQREWDEVQDSLRKKYAVGRTSIDVVLENVRICGSRSSQGYNKMRITLNAIEEGAPVDPVVAEKIDGYVREYFPKY